MVKNMGNYNFELDLDSENTMSVIDSWIKEETDVLEFGCANGRLTKHLAKNRKCCMTIVEIDDESGKEAAAYAKYSFIGKEEGDINNFYWLNIDKRFDYIIFADVLEHLTNPQLVLDKCKEILKSEGEILVSIPNISHNSVLIGLFNDDFCYAKSGLLDETHIHFFTYSTFCHMIDQLGLRVVREHPIYSRVGWNEIDNEYSDVPYSVEKELRSRIEGSIYQYVFAISKQEVIQKQCSSSISVLEEDLVRQEEASCFIWSGLENRESANRCGIVYSPHNVNILQFSINSIVSKIRIDVIECNALVKIESILIKAQNDNEKEAEIIEHNAAHQIGKLFYFNDIDPYIYIDVKEMENVCLDYVKVKFKLLDRRMTDEQLQIYNCIYDNLDGFDEKTECGILNHTLNRLRESVLDLENDISQQKEYIGHLENDISQQKEYAGHLENDISQQKEYIEHLEKDIFDQKADIMQLQQNTIEQDNYIEHLEQDIFEQKRYITDLEGRIGNKIRNALKRGKRDV